MSSIPGSGRSPRGENSNPLQYYCLENFMEEEPGRLQPHRFAKTQHMTEGLLGITGKSTEDFQDSGTTLYSNTMVVDAYHYKFIQAHRIENTNTGT